MQFDGHDSRRDTIPPTEIRGGRIDSKICIDEKMNTTWTWRPHLIWSSHLMALWFIHPSSFTSTVYRNSDHKLLPNPRGVHCPLGWDEEAFPLSYWAYLIFMQGLLSHGQAEPTRESWIQPICKTNALVCIKKKKKMSWGLVRPLPGHARPRQNIQFRQEK